MTDVGEIVGAIMTGLTRARQMADEESVAVAKEYRDNPLLEGVTIPRIRLPEVTLDIPVLIESFDVGEPAQIEKPEVLVCASIVVGFRNAQSVVTHFKSIQLSPACLPALE